MPPATKPDSQRTAPARTAGFTLIEVLVVITVLAILGTMVAVRWRSDDPAELASQSIERFAETLEGTCQSAVLQARPASLRIDDSGYQAHAWTEQRWQATGPAHPWPPGSRPQLSVEGGNDDAGGIFCDATGQWTPFQLRLRLESASATLNGDAAGQLRRSGQ